MRPSVPQHLAVSMASTGVFCSGGYLGCGGPASAGRQGHARCRNCSAAGGGEGPGTECGQPLRNKLQRGRINSVVVRGWGSVGSVGWGSATGAVIGGAGPTRRLRPQGISQRRAPNLHLDSPGGLKAANQSIAKLQRDANKLVKFESHASGRWRRASSIATLL